MYGNTSQIAMGKRSPWPQYTSFHIGGPADLLVAPESVDELQGLLKEAKKYAVPTFILGNGSNLLVRDGGIRGLVIKLGNHLNGLSACGVTMEAGAGVSLAQAARFAAESGLSGLEFAVGIPGSLGGAVIMNAGAYDGDMGHVVKSVTALNGTGEIVRLTQKDLDFSYRHSALQYQDLVVLSVSFVLKPEEQQIIEAKMADFSRRRRTKQPLDYPSAGSTFKRPFGHYAAALIDEAGLKGMRVGECHGFPKARWLCHQLREGNGPRYLAAHEIHRGQGLCQKRRPPRTGSHDHRRRRIERGGHREQRISLHPYHGFFVWNYGDGPEIFWQPFPSHPNHRAALFHWRLHAPAPCRAALKRTVPCLPKRITFSLPKPALLVFL